MTTTNGPTLNESYNAVLRAWAKEGCEAEPHCEDCGCDLTGADVIETPYEWLCLQCADEKGWDHSDSFEWEPAEPENFIDDDERPFYLESVHGREDFHAD
jgi:hypothetical protein